VRAGLPRIAEMLEAHLDGARLPCGLQEYRDIPIVGGMAARDRWQTWKKAHGVRHLLLLSGILLVIVSPAIGILPGPGGIFVFAAGLALILEASTWAKRLYVRVKRRWPKAGAWLDWGLRRRSARRRRERMRPAAVAMD
jgi:hypothetical protein